MNDDTLLDLVHARVRLIPPGQVMSYGQVGDEPQAALHGGDNGCRYEA